MPRCAAPSYVNTVMVRYRPDDPACLAGWLGPLLDEHGPALRYRVALPGQRILLRFATLSDVRPIWLALLVPLMLLMPISYRAGTETSHAHTIFQGIVDTITGYRHHHAGDAGPGAETIDSPALSPAAPAVVSPGSSTHEHDANAESHAGEGRDRHANQATAPDVPEQMGLYSPIESTSAVHELGSLVALLLSGAVCASLWSRANRLLQVCITEDPPPPRLALC